LTVRCFVARITGLTCIVLAALASAASASSFSGISAGHQTTCAVVSGGKVACWGTGLMGNPAPYASSTPVIVNGLDHAVEVTGGEQDHRCALISDGTARCWGVDLFGELGDGRTSTDETWTPVAVSGLTSAVQISAGEEETCAVLAEGAVQCWGANNWGQLGNGTTTNSSTPVSVSGLHNAVSVSVGFPSACAIVSGGTVDCWGSNVHGQLGNGGAPTSSSTPVAVSGLTNAVSVSVNFNYACAVLAGGTVKCWGSGDGGLGSSSSTPVAVSGISNATAVSTGIAHACALLATGHVACWGANGGFYAGALGNGTTEGSLTPVPVSNLSTAIAVSAGFFHSCAVLSDGTAECWGQNSDGALGNATTTSSLIPVLVSEPVSVEPVTSPPPGETTPGSQNTNQTTQLKTQSSATTSHGTPVLKTPTAANGGGQSRRISPAAAFGLPSAKQCVSRRRFTIHVRQLRGITWIGAAVRINRKVVKTVGRRHIRALVSLVGLPKGTFVLSITALASDGRTVTGTRTYHTCVPKGKSHYAAPKL
jgi:alpha-tubulin suppressor-like RCC1 family protein